MNLRLKIALPTNTDAREDDHSAVASVALSPEFLQGNAAVGLEKIRTRLLDLTNRNRLLNFRHSASSSLRIVNVDIDTIFRRLMDGEKLPFQAVPEPSAEFDNTEFFDGEDTGSRTVKPSAQVTADFLGWQTSYDLDLGGNGENGGNSDALPVLHYIEGLETLTRKIGSAAKSAIEESGTNMLYLVFGFLEWYEDDNSQQPRYAPLLTVPVTLERNGGKGKGFECTLEFSGDDSTTNLSLAERMRRDFALELPNAEDDDSPETYFAHFKNVLEQKKHWRIRRQVSLTLLSFGKLLMYRDLDPKSWPGIVKHPLVKELFEGVKSESIAHAEEYDIDDPALKSDVPSLILDADSSQHSALIHALRGQNLVIEGPPGTGKSQTITNLIAIAIGKGKTVLFVAEKLAALEVVRRRLDAAGLGIFCLELHSHKTKKHILLNDLAGRIKARGSFREPREIEFHLAVVDEKKRVLTQYVNLINKRIEPLDMTIFEVLWARERCYRELPFSGEIRGDVPEALRYTRPQLAAKEHLVSVYAQHLGNVLRVCSSVEDHAWSWVKKSLGFEEEERIIFLLSSFASVLEDMQRLLVELKTRSGIELNESITGLRTVSEYLSELPASDSSLDGNLIAACRCLQDRKVLRDFIKDVKSASSQFDVLQQAIENPRQLLRSEVAKALQNTSAQIKSIGLDFCNHSRLQDILAFGQAIEAKLSDVQVGLMNVQALLGCDPATDIHGTMLLISCIRLLESAPETCLHMRIESLAADGASKITHDAAVEALDIRKQRELLNSNLDLAYATETVSTQQLEDFAKDVEEAGILQRLFGRKYRNARKLYRRLSLKGRKATRDQISCDLRAISDYRRKRNRFDSDPLYQGTFGVQFRGVDTDWDSLVVLVNWYEEVLSALPEHDASSAQFLDILLRGRSERLKALKASIVAQAVNINMLEQVQDAIASLNENLGFSASLTGSVKELCLELRSRNQTISSALDNLSNASVRDNQPCNKIPGLLLSVTNYKGKLERISTDNVARNLLGNRFKESDTAVEEIESALAFAERIVQSKLPQDVTEWILCEDFTARIQRLQSGLSSVSSYRDELIRFGNELDQLSKSTFWSAYDNEPLDVLKQCVQYVLEGKEELAPWVQFLRVRQESLSSGFEKLMNLAERNTLLPEHLVPAFRFLFYNSLSRNIFAEYPLLHQFDGLTQERIRQQFAHADTESIRLNSERLAYAIDRRYVPTGRQSGQVSLLSDLALITHEINKQKRHIPIRQLVRRAGGALQALKPCFMLGPLSVAQYLVPGSMQFDLIVMDEASQLKPEDAIGAIARGTQIVIVGDPKQLPPTNFFQRVSLDADEDSDDTDRTVLEEGESILDVASTLYQPIRRLRWHYRSRHHSLIAFSNREFYDDDLVIFPSAFHDDADLGVKYHAVSEGILESRRNAPEAERVVKAVLEHMETKPDQSLGVVTLNLEQRELIEELLDKRLRADPFASAYQERMNNGAEPFFVKNLENVQGDERDVIFISVTYGPDAKGNFYQRFGPINGANGHRRLNVLFTRAKRRLEVFSSLDPDRIHTNAGSTWGLRALKAYLTFAQTGVLDTPDEGSDQPTNDFENSVGFVLKEKGFSVVPQVGVAGFFLDLAVKHPTKPGKYLLGIECDGASYHSGRSARDRDRLRQEILEKLGWNIHRIWSTDWFKNRPNEIRRLFDYIDSLLSGDPDYRRIADRANIEESLRKQLIDLRDRELRAAFPDSPAENGLLRKKMLERFVAARPTSKDEWFRVFSTDMRTNTDSRQVHQYLERVLEIIRASHD